MAENKLDRMLRELESQRTPPEKVSRQTGRQYRRSQFVRKNDRLMRIVARRYIIPYAGYIDGTFEGRTLLHSGEHIKYPKNSRYQQRLKRRAAKCTRRCRGLSGKGNRYRRLFEYEWMLY